MYWKGNEDFEDDFFNDETASGEALNEIKKEQERISNLPVMIQAVQLYDIVSGIVETFSSDDEISLHYKEVMVSDVRKMRNRIIATEDAEHFSIKM